MATSPQTTTKIVDWYRNNLQAKPMPAFDMDANSQTVAAIPQGGLLDDPTPVSQEQKATPEPVGLLAEPAVKEQKTTPEPIGLLSDTQNATANDVFNGTASASTGAGHGFVNPAYTAANPLAQPGYQGGTTFEDHMLKNGGTPSPAAPTTATTPATTPTATTPPPAQANTTSRNVGTPPPGYSRATYKPTFEDWQLRGGRPPWDVDGPWDVTAGPTGGTGTTPGGTGGAGTPGGTGTTAGTGGAATLDPNKLTDRVLNPNETTAGQIPGLLDSPIAQQARARSDMKANSRGLLNSSIATAAGEAAALDAILQVARDDAAAQRGAGDYNTALRNQTQMYNTDQINAFLLKQMGIQADAAAQDKSILAQLDIAKLQDSTARWNAERQDATSRYNTDQNYRSEQDRTRMQLANNIMMSADMPPARRAALLRAMGFNDLADAIYVVTDVVDDINDDNGGGDGNNDTSSGG